MLKSTMRYYPVHMTPLESYRSLSIFSRWMKIVLKISLQFTAPPQLSIQVKIHSASKRPGLHRKTKKLFMRPTLLRRPELPSHEIKTLIRRWGYQSTHTTTQSLTNKVMPDSKEILHGSQKTLLKENDDSLNKIAPSQIAPQTSTESNKLQFVIDKIVEYKKTLKETLYQVRWY